MANKERNAIKAAMISLWFNVVLFVFKFTALMIVHSLAIATDFAITVVGLTVSFILYKSLKLSNKPADLFHNYGYGKVEHVCEAMEGVVLVGIACIMSFQAMASLLHTKAVTFPWIGFASSVFSLSLNFVGAFLIFRIAKKSRSPAVKAEAIHYTLEGFISSAIACSFLLAIFIKGTPFHFIEPYLDPSVTILVGILISVPSIKLARQAFVSLLDSSIEEPSKMDTIVRLALHSDHYCNFKDIKTRGAGHKKFIELKLVMPKDMPFADAYEKVSMIEKSIMSTVEDSEVTINMVPCDKDCGLAKENKPCPYLKHSSQKDPKHQGCVR
jgi:cation diffusion facilitator family transporter